MKNKVLITGSKGFVGQNLKGYLEKEGIEVFQQSLRGINIQHIPLNNYDIIIHLAGLVQDSNKSSTFQDYLQINTELTKELFDHFITSSSRIFIYFSSVKAVAGTYENVLKEDVDAKPTSYYGKSKLLSEQYIMSQSLPREKKVFIFRPCIIHGPGNKGNIYLLYKMVKKRFPWPLADFDNKRSFLSIDNLQFIINQVIINDRIPGGIYNLSDDESLSTNKLITLISEVLGRRPQLWRISADFIVKLVSLGNILHLPFNIELLNKLTDSFVVCNQKIKLALGVSNLPFTLEEGLIKTIKSFKRESL